jgi:predicted CXXCH cytochrome family protein
MRNPSSFALTLFASVLLLVVPTRPLHADVDCLSCHGDTTMQDANGKNIGVDANKFHAGVHSILKCNDCHKDIHGYPHPDHPAKVQCESCHTNEATDLAGSVHSNRNEHPCTSCHGNAHEIVPKTDPNSTVYPLNIPKTCGACHGDPAMAKKYHLPNVYALYIDSIHGFALGKEGLLVAANCTSCHGSHKILTHTDPQSSTYRTNIPGTCGSCHVGINEQYQKGVHGQAVAAGSTKAPVCTDCHTAHGIVEPTSADFRMQSTPICGSCHRDNSPPTATPSTRSSACSAATSKQLAVGTATRRTTSGRPPIPTPPSPRRISSRPAAAATPAPTPALSSTSPMPTRAIAG